MMDTMRSSQRKPTPLGTAQQTTLHARPAPRVDIPPYDRTVDVVCHRRQHGDPVPDRAEIFSASLRAFLSSTRRRDGKKNRSDGHYSGLPDAVRFGIHRLLIAETVPTTKPITLSREFSTKDAWPPGSLTPLRTVLAPLRRYLQVSSAFRTDLLLALFSTAQFHVTSSPYVEARLSPLATTWFLAHAPFMRSIVLEVDMTGLGCGSRPHAGALSPALGRVEAHLKEFALAQRNRRSRHSPLGELVLLCRRYHGDRQPRSQQDTTPTPKVSELPPLAPAPPPPPPPPAPERRVLRKKQSLRSFSKVESPAPAPAPAEGEDVQTRRINRKVSFSVLNARAKTPDPATTITATPTPAPTPVVTEEVEEEDTTAAAALTPTPSNPRPAAAPRQEIEEPEEEPLGPYCPHDYLNVCRHLLRLRGMVDAVRLCGFTEDFTHDFARSLFPPERGRFPYRLAPSGAWPPMRGQRSRVDLGDGGKEGAFLFRHDDNHDDNDDDNDDDGKCEHRKEKKKKKKKKKNKKKKGLDTTYMRPIIPPRPILGPNGPYLPARRIPTASARESGVGNTPSATRDDDDDDEPEGAAAAASGARKRFGGMFVRRKGTARKY
ncbi:hypothetical protein N3K66_008489 [Trichothecium roseum]|uniref:Uncharacterized protein n=1 Tax=Trichothecium roseum TaxID=47278 RepID=A0ACC0UQV1_9HYPO|nr:hypothetical protein N3K66_008489 [Trichothecium roseum]